MEDLPSENEEHPEEPYDIPVADFSGYGGMANIGLVVGHFWEGWSLRRKTLSVPDSGEVTHRPVDERRVIRAAKRIVRLAGDRVDQDLCHDMQGIEVAIDDAVPRHIEAQLVEFFSES